MKNRGRLGARHGPYHSNNDNGKCEEEKEETARTGTGLLIASTIVIYKGGGQNWLRDSRGCGPPSSISTVQALAQAITRGIEVGRSSHHVQIFGSHGQIAVHLI